MPEAHPPLVPESSVTIVIVNWNSGRQLRDCVASIQKFGCPWVHRVVVVDNGSADGSERGAEDQPGVALIRAGDNFGFAAACNLGARSADGDYLLFLNPDAALYEGTIPAVVGFMDSPANSTVGICGVKLIDEVGHVARSCARFPSVSSMAFHAIGVDRVQPRLGYFMAEWDHQQSRAVDHVIGAFFLVRTSLFCKLGGFDERFFVYLEDLDFSRRAHQGGWQSMYLAETQAFHAGGGASRQIKARRLFYAQRSRLLYAFKHFSALGAVLVAIATLLIEPVSRSGLALLRLSWPGLKETWLAYGMLMRWLPVWVLKGQTR